jgi:hypothetical protein
MGIALVVAAAVGAPASYNDPTRNTVPPPGPKLIEPPPDALFWDNFSDPKLEGWQVTREGAWSVRNGVLRGDLPDAPQEYAFIYAGKEDWKDYALDFDVCGIRGVDKGGVVRVEGKEGVGTDLRGPGYQDVLLHRGLVPLGKADAPNANGTWHHVRIEAKEDYYRVFIDDVLKVVRRDKANHRPRGRIALAAYTGGVGECTVYYDNVVVTPLK